RSARRVATREVGGIGEVLVHTDGSALRMIAGEEIRRYHCPLPMNPGCLRIVGGGGPFCGVTVYRQASIDHPPSLPLSTSVQRPANVLPAAEPRGVPGECGNRSSHLP